MRGPHTLLAAQLCRVHGLAKHLDCHSTRLLQGAVLLVVLLQQAGGACIVGTGTCCLPATVVARGVAEVELKLALGVPPGVNERDAEGSETTVLCVSLLKVAKSSHKLLAGNVFVVGKEVSLGGLAGVVDEDVGIGRHASDSTDHVAMHRQIFRTKVATSEPCTYSFRMYSFSADVSCSNSLDVTLRSAAKTMPSLARIPMAVPAWEMASRAYSTW